MTLALAALPRHVSDRELFSSVYLELSYIAKLLAPSQLRSSLEWITSEEYFPSIHYFRDFSLLRFLHAPDHKRYLAFAWNMTVPRIAVIGAGPAGLVLARILQHNGMQCTIFELDKDRFARDQGGIVDLHPQSGQMALREAELFEEFQKRSLPAAEAMKLIKSDGTVCWDENSVQAIKAGHSRDQPEIDRGVLRDMLLNSVDLESIHWDKKLIRVVPSDTSENKYNIEFIDGVETGFDLVIGADGAWSKVRPLLTDQQPFYSGITIIELKAQEVNSRKE